MSKILVINLLFMPGILLLAKRYLPHGEALAVGASAVMAAVGVFGILMIL